MDRAEAVDAAETSAERWRALAYLVPVALVAFIEGFLRELCGILALLLCVGAVVGGVFDASVWWAVGLVVAGVAGAALIVVTLVRRWSFVWQWIIYVGVLIAEGALIAIARV